MSIDEQIAVMKAFKEGKTIECKIKNDDYDPWEDTPSPTWNFSQFDYRIKPEEEDDDPPSYPSEFEYGGNTYHVNELDFSKDMDGNILIGIKGIKRSRIVGGCKEKENESSERMTNRQLAEWLAKGNGDWNMTDSNYPSISYVFNSDEEDEPVDEKARIRRFGSDEWIVPTKEIYEHDCTIRGLTDFLNNLTASKGMTNPDEDEDGKPVVIGSSDEAYCYQGKTGWFADTPDDIENKRITNPERRYHGVLTSVKNSIYNMVSDRKDRYGDNVPYAFFMPDEVLK